MSTEQRSVTLRGLARKVRELLRRVARPTARSASASLPLTGFDEARSRAPYLELLTDEELAELNALLPWSTYTIDGRGRRFGDRASSSKRVSPQPVPDRRIVAMHERFDLIGKDVLEVGCFEGVHTAGLCELGAQVTAVDVRIVNVVKTVVRCAFYGHHPTAFVCNLETWEDDDALRADLVHHVGVLYHMQDPVRHLQRLGRVARRGLMLDTHIAEDHQATESMVIDEVTYRYKHFAEARGPEHVFAGAFDHAKWLRLDDILELLDHSGFDADVVEHRAEANGPRVIIFAERKTG